jgi:hypothetical protein
VILLRPARAHAIVFLRFPKESGQPGGMPYGEHPFLLLPPCICTLKLPDRIVLSIEQDDHMNIIVLYITTMIVIDLQLRANS